MTHLHKILFEYKWFSSIFIVMTVLLLSRIPMGTFNDPSELDVLGHFVLVATGAPLSMVLMTGYGILPKFESDVHYIVATSLLGISLEVLWEVFEFMIDMIFSLSWQVNNTDTMVDIILGILGATAGAILFVKIYGVKSLSA